jgi:hypothetical protein
MHAIHLSTLAGRQVSSMLKLASSPEAHISIEAIISAEKSAILGRGEKC